ncbi:tetraspanin-2-like [Penaeus monodon]|uniref:tetraspanin-2-like n=1 Tax=Penaeus monodon TaxID=6687 RepID=UPI0018A7CACB|nr:tetraspanin-2-like [Penaeus monodon]
MGQGGGHGYGRGKGGRGEGSTAEFLMKLIMLFNLFFIIMGAAMVSFGFWITLDTEFKRWVKDLGMEHFWVGVYILMAAGGLLMVQSFFGICGAYQRKSTLLLIFQGCLVVCFVLEIVGAAYMLANGIRYSRIEYWLTDRFYNLIDVYNYDQASARI